MSSLPNYDKYEEPTARLDEITAPQPTDTLAPEIEKPQSQSDSLKPGSILNGRYQLLEIIGRGGTSLIYRGIDQRQPAGAGHIAIKLLQPGLHSQPAAAERLKEEFKIAKMLAHPNTVRAYELECGSTGNGHCFFTMELLEGSTLASLMRAAESPFDMDRARRILRTCAEVLIHAHRRGVVHGDFKPANVFITRRGDVKVLDFGNARRVDTDFDDGQKAATPCYASPEVLMGLKPEQRDDVFSFACVAYELFNVRHPYDRRSSLEARGAKLMPPRAWSLRENQWKSLEAALSFTRETRPALSTLIAQLLLTSGPAAAPVPVLADTLRPTHRVAEAKRPPPPASWVSKFLALLLATALAAGTLLIARLEWHRHPALKDDLTLSLSEMLNRLQNLRVSTPSSSLPSSPAPPASTTTAAPVPVDPPLPVHVDEEPAQAAPARAVQTPPRSIPPVAPARVAFAETAVVVGERTNMVVLRVDRLQSLTGRSTVRWRAVSGTAREGEDFAPSSGIIAFPEGHDTRMLYIPIIDDERVEGNESFTVELFEPDRNTVIGTPAEVTITILDEEG